MVDEKQIKALLDQHFAIDGKVTINSNTGTVSVVGSVYLLSSIKVTQLPVSFEQVSKWFDCSRNQLSSLKGAPAKVGEYFNCSNNQLDSLIGAPTEVGGEFVCYSNNLVNLVGSPSHVMDDFSCYNNNLASFDGAPLSVVGVFYCDYAKNLPLLRLLTYQHTMLFGAPELFDLIFEKHAGRGRRGAIQAAREMLDLGEKIQKEQALDHNPFEANARW
jgi:hypothetical protein